MIGCLDGDIEGVGFGDDTLATQIIGLRPKIEDIDLAVKTRQFDGQTDILGGKRFVVSIGIDMKLRGYAGFENRDLNGKVILC